MINGMARPESRENSASRTVDFLRRTGAIEFAQQITSGERAAPSFEEFRDYLIRLNGIIRKVPAHKRSADGRDVHLKNPVETIGFPRQEDKETLLREAYEAIPKITGGDAKYLLPAAINAVHLFADGNGRTSRLVHFLLREPSPEKDRYAELTETLGNLGRYETLDVNPGEIAEEIEYVVLARHGWTFDEDGLPQQLGPIQSAIAAIELKRIDGTSTLYGAAEEFFNLYEEGALYGLTALYEELHESGIEEVSQDYNGAKRISPLKLSKKLSEGDWRDLTDRLYELKKEHVETLIRIFTEPEKYRVDDGPETIRERFVTLVEKQS